MTGIQDIHIGGFIPLVSPRELKAELPSKPEAAALVLAAREAIARILSGDDHRLLVVVGPCSIHDEAAALDYAARLAELARQTAERLLIVMRIYFEKPRTTIGWKGLINDPYLNGSFDIAEGLRRARTLLLRVAELGMPAATEMLDPISPQYTADLVSWGSIGARTTESQTHRQMASGLSMPIGFKNATDGDLQIALDAMEASRHQHSFLGIDDDGKTCIVHTMGNPWGHIILRGGRSGPNYAPAAVAEAKTRLRASGFAPRVMIDCSHANSERNFRNQAKVFRSALAQRRAGDANVIGVMLESNLCEGKQTLTGDARQLRYGQSITDACIGWDETAVLIEEAWESLGREHSSVAAK